MPHLLWWSSQELWVVTAAAAEYPILRIAHMQRWKTRPGRKSPSNIQVFAPMPVAHFLSLVLQPSYQFWELLMYSWLISLMLLLAWLLLNLQWRNLAISWALRQYCGGYSLPQSGRNKERVYSQISEQERDGANPTGKCIIGLGSIYPLWFVSGISPSSLPCPKAHVRQNDSIVRAIMLPVD